MTSLHSPTASINRLGYSQLTDRLAVDDSVTWGIHDQALALQRQGEDVILLCVGDPDFPTPAPIIDNAVSYMRVNRTHYSPALGELNLRRAVADLETRTSPHPCKPEEVVIFPGATAAIFAVLSCLLNPGDDLVVPEPMYVGYPGIFQAIGVNLIPAQTDPEQNFALDIDQVMATITSNTKAVMINTPNNPSGHMLTQTALAELAARCLERGIWLVCDEVYSMITFNRDHRSLRASATSLENVVTIDGLSKSHAMSGWRMGWAICPPNLVEHLRHLNTATLFGSPQFIQDAAAFALSNDEYYVAEMRDEYQRRRDHVVNRIEQIPGVSCQSPDAGMFVMMNVSGLGDSDVAIGEALLAQHRVSTVPGSGFGSSSRDHLRLTLAKPIPELDKAMDRIEAFARGIVQTGS